MSRTASGTSCASRRCPTRSTEPSSSTATFSSKPFHRRSPVVEIEVTVRRLGGPSVRDAATGRNVEVGPEIDEHRAWTEYRRARPRRLLPSPAPPLPCARRNANPRCPTADRNPLPTRGGTTCRTLTGASVVRLMFPHTRLRPAGYKRRTRRRNRSPHPAGRTIPPARNPHTP